MFDEIIRQKSKSDFLIAAFLDFKLFGIVGFIQAKMEKKKHIRKLEEYILEKSILGKKSERKYLKQSFNISSC